MAWMDIFKRKAPEVDASSESIKKETPRVGLKNFTTVLYQGFEEKKFSVYSELLTEADKAVHTDGFVRQAVSRLKEIAIRQDFWLNSGSEETLKYIKQRLFEIEHISSKTFKEIVTNIIDSLVKYANAYLILNRGNNSVSGSPYMYFGKELRAVTSFYTINPLYMKVIVDVFGNPILYQYDPKLKNDDYIVYCSKKTEEEAFEIYGKDRNGTITFKANDVIHFKYDGENSLFGRPFFLEALDDLIMLRKMEELIDSMWNNGMFNAVIYKVGNEKVPPKESDLEMVMNTLQWNPSDGVVIVPGTHEVKYLEAQNITQLINLMKHFKERFFSGIGMSTVSMGESGSSNRATAETTNESMFDKVRMIQNIISIKMHTFFEHLIMDGKYDIFKIDPDNLPTLVFPEPDFDRQTKKEAAEISKYEHNVQTETETRKNIGLSSLKNREDMHLYRITLPVSQIKNKESEENNVTEEKNERNPR